MLHVKERPGVRVDAPVRARPVEPARRPWLPALLRGAAGHCPACGEGALFARGLRVRAHCAQCGEALYHERAGRPGLLLAAFLGAQGGLALMGMGHAAGLALPFVLWPAAAVVATALLLRPAKGAVVGLQWALRLHGFQYAAMCQPCRNPRRARPAGRKRA